MTSIFLALLSEVAANRRAAQLERCPQNIFSNLILVWVMPDHFQEVTLE